MPGKECNDTASVGYIDRAQKRPYSGKGTLSGVLDVKITCLAPLHIGSGTNRLSSEGMPECVMTMNGSPVIPGSSLKGCVRNIASAVSRSCAPRSKCTMKAPDDCCIVCRTFGMMGFASCVDFTELVPEKPCETICIKQPAPHSPKYPDDRKIKFYKDKAECPGNNEMLNIDAVPAGTAFTGKIFYRKLTEEQLSLLLFSLGLDGTIGLSLGGFRYNGLGRISVSAESAQCDASALAGRYEQYAVGSGCSAQLAKLRGILGAKGGGK